MIHDKKETRSINLKAMAISYIENDTVSETIIFSP